MFASQTRTEPKFCNVVYFNVTLSPTMEFHWNRNLCWNASYRFKMFRWFTGIGPQQLVSFSPNLRAGISLLPNPGTLRFRGSLLGSVRQITTQTILTKPISTADSPELISTKPLPIPNAAPLTVYVSCTPSLPVFLCHFTHVSLNMDKLLNNSSSVSKTMKTEWEQLFPMQLQWSNCLFLLFPLLFFQIGKTKEGGQKFGSKFSLNCVSSIN